MTARITNAQLLAAFTAMAEGLSDRIGALETRLAAPVEASAPAKAPTKRAAKAAAKAPEALTAKGEARTVKAPATTGTTARTIAVQPAAKGNPLLGATGPELKALGTKAAKAEIARRQANRDARKAARA